MEVIYHALNPSGHVVLTVCVIIHPQPHIDNAFPHFWAIFNNKVILLSTLDGQKLWKKQHIGQQQGQMQIKDFDPIFHFYMKTQTKKCQEINLLRYQILGRGF